MLSVLPADTRDFPYPLRMSFYQVELNWMRDVDDLSLMDDEEVEGFICARGGEQFLIGAVKECVSQMVDIVVDCAEYELKTRRILPIDLVEDLNIDKYHVTKLKRELEASGYDEYRDKEFWCCEICSCNENEIENRPCDDILYPHYHKNWEKAKLCCFSCYMWEDNKDSNGRPVAHTCSQCGVFELMEDDDGDSLEGTFIVPEGREHQSLCLRCHDELNGFCSLSDISSDDEDVYEGEYENEDLPENNEEKAKKIKDFVKEAGEVVYDVQEDISEGNYLKLMDLLQKITNEVNSL